MKYTIALAAAVFTLMSGAVQAHSSGALKFVAKSKSPQMQSCTSQSANRLHNAQNSAKALGQLTRTSFKRNYCNKLSSTAIAYQYNNSSKLERKARRVASL